MRIIVTVEDGCVTSVVSDTDHVKCSVLDLDGCDDPDDTRTELIADQEKMSKTGFCIF